MHIIKYQYLNFYERVALQALSDLQIWTGIEN